MKKIVLIFAIMLLTFTVAHAQWVINEGFESTFPPTGWLSESPQGDLWAQDDGTDHGPGTAYAGAYAAMYNNYDYSGGNSASMTTPAFDISAQAAPQLDFYWWNDDGTYNPAYMLLYKSTDGATFTQFDSISTHSSGGWLNYNTPLTTDITHIKFEAVSDYGVKNTFIDNFMVGQPNPYDVIVDQLTPDAVIIEGTSYNYYMKVSNIGLNVDVYDLTLAGGTWVYDIRDKDDTGTIASIGIAAGAADTVIVKVTAPVAKDVSDMVTFTATSQADPGVSSSDDITTGAYFPYLSLFENFDACVAPALPPKWSRIVETTSTYPYVNTYNSATYAYSDTISVKMYNSSDLAAELLLVTPALQTGVWGNVITAMVRSSSGDQDILVGTITDPTDPSTFSLVQSFPVTGTYTEIACQIDFAKSEGYVAFKHACNGTYDYYYIDDVAWVEIIPEPYMVIDETEHDFGMVDQGTVDTWDVTIYNDGYGTLYIDDATVNPPFSVTYPDSIEPVSNGIATVTLDATDVGMYLDVLEFHTNAPQDSTIDLSVLVKGTDYVMEGFEETTFPPFGWENPDGYWVRQIGMAYEGQGYAYTNKSHVYDAIFITPRLEINGGDFIDFFWRNSDLYPTKVINGDTLFVEISNTYLNTAPTWECIAMLTANAPMDDYEEVFVNIPDTYIGNNAKIRWRHRTELAPESQGVGLDNIIMPAPYLPINFSVEPCYASDYIGPGNPIQYTYDVTNMGIWDDRFIILVQDSSAIRYSKDVEDFETSDGGWVATADWDPVGDWAWTPTYDITNYTGANTPPPAAHSGTGLWATVPEGDYTNAGGSSYMSKTVDFSGITDAYLNFWYWSDINGTWDYCDVIVNSDILWTIDTHTPTAWEVASLDLSAYDGMSDVQILFSFYASTVVEKAGMYIDDVDYPGGSGPGPSPTGWPVTVSPPFLELAPGETGSFVATVSVPEDATIDAGQLTPILTYSREDNTVQHQVLVSALCHLKDPYEPNNVIVDATPWGYGQVTDGAQIYYNADYVDEDIDIYEFDGLAGAIIVCDFDLDPDETVFDGAIKLTDVDSTEIAFADEWAGGGSEQLKYRLLEDGTYYLVLGKWDNVLDGPYKKDSDRGENTCYYEMVLTLIPSPEVAVSPDSLQLGIVYSKETASVDLFIENTGVIGCDDLSYDIDVMIPGIETLYQSGFDDAGDWAVSGGTNWGLTNTNNAGGTPPEARFYWSPNLTALQRLISPVINTTGSTSADLTFKHYLDYYADGTLVGVQTTSDGGATWNTVWSISPTADMGPETVPVTIDNSDMGSDQFQLCWFFDGISFDINNWYVDDVKLSVGGEAWVEVSPSLGLIGQGATQTCVVTCDDTGLTDPGVYTADIIVHNNAMLDGASDVVIPLTFFYQIAAQGMIGTVTYLQTGDPLEGVMVSAGNFVTYTDADGFYQFTDIASGIYDVTFQKDGFATLVKYGIYVSPNWVSLLNVEMLFDGAVPENLIANGIPEAIELDWDKPSGGGGGGQILYELIQHDGNPVNGYYQSFGNGYGVVYDVSGYTNVTLDQLDFRHSSWGLSGIWDYSLHIVDWDTYTEVAVITGLQTTGDDQWENGIDLGSISETGLVGVFLEPLGNISTDAYPDLDADDVGPGGLSYYGALSSYADMLLSDIGDFLMDLWILADETDVPVQAQVFPAQISHNQPTRNPVTNQNITSVSTVQKVNTNTSSREADLLGYNVYEATKGFVSYLDGENNTYFIDDIVAVDVPYTYCVTAVYDEGESSPSNTATATPLAPSGGYHDTFDLDWSTTGWVQDPAGGNWIWAAGYANLYWSPSAAPYDMSLISPEIDLPDDPLDVYDLTVSMYVDNYTSFDGEVWEIWLINDGGEDLLWSWDDPTADWGVSGGSDWVYTDTGQYSGQTVQVKFRSHGATTFNFDNWFIYDVFFDYADIPPVYGALEGAVTDGEGNLLEGVAVDADFLDYNTVYTDVNGFYSIDPMRVGLYDITYSKLGYSTILEEDVEILVGDTTVVDVVLGNPTMDIDPTSIPDAIVPVGGTSTRTITVTNNGNAPLDWGASLENLTDTQYTINYDLQTNPPTPENSEMAPVGKENYEGGNNSKDTWDILFNFNAVEAGQPGIETNGQHIYTADWRSTATATFYEYEMDGTSVESFNIAGATEIRDMAYDGTYFYGSAASMSINIMDLEAQTLIGTIPVTCAGVTGVRHIAYDPELDGGNGGFWVGNWDELGAITMTGSQIYSASSVTSVYGSAYDQYTDGGPYLWLFAQPSANAIMQQFEIATQSLTGVTHDCSDAPGFNAGISGGAATYCADGKLILLANIQQDPNLIVAYELAPFATWIAIDPNAGTVDPYGAFEEVTVTFDAGDDPAGTIHTCDILFESAQGVPSVTVPVTLMVGNPEYGTLTGTVTAATGGALIEGAEITASDDADNTYVTYTNASGVYTIEDMMVGYYTVECTADGYNYHVEVDVPITAGNVTTLNFALLAPVMTVNPLVINTSVDPATPIQVDITIDNDGDGPLEWFASLDQPVSIPRESGNHPVGPNAVSAEGVPQGLDPVYGANEPNFTLTRGSVGWGIEAVDGSGCWIDTDAPDILNDVFVPTFATYAGEFGPDNDTHMYFFDNDTQNLIYVEMATGTVTTIGPTGIGSTTEFMNDMACDRTTGTMYGVFNNSIYTVDLATGACTLVGAIGNTGGMMIAIAVDGNGDMWGHDLGLDEIWTIDKATGTGMSVGSTGFDANYAQSMAWDPLTNIVYLAAFNGTNFYYELRTVDLTTGATALLGGVYYKEIVAFSFPGDATTPWITIGPSSDVVPAGGTSTLCVFLNTVDYPIGEILFANIEIISDPDVGVVTVPVTVIVSDTVSSGETPVIETSLYANFPNPMLNSTTFNFSLRERSHVTLSIYNVKGQLVDVILNEDLDPCAQHPVVWNGTANGKKLANGIYFYKLETNSKTFLKKMILMK